MSNLSSAIIFAAFMLTQSVVNQQRLFNQVATVLMTERESDQRKKRKREHEELLQFPKTENIY